MAAYEIPGYKIGVLQANADLSTKQYQVVDLVAASGTTAGTEGAAVDVAANGSAALGILQNAPIIGEPAEIVTSGISKAQYGATVALNDLLMVSSGKLIKATSTNFAVAKALIAGASGTVGSVYLHNYGVQA